MTQPLPRPSTVDEVRERMQRFATEDSRQRGLDIEVRNDDVFIATYLKCGTTWMQQIVHALRTRGAMDFGEIGDVVPWLEMAHDVGMDPQAPQVATPRAFKSHLHWDNVPRGGRYINIVRDPRAVAVSMYRFLEGWLFVEGSIDVDTFVAEFFVSGSGSGRYWQHVNAWWPVRDRDDVLVLCYEDLVAEPARCIRQVASFIGTTLDDALLDIVLHRSSREFMTAHAGQFDDHVVRAMRDPAMRLPPGKATTKVQASGAARRHQLGAHSLASLDACWNEEVTPRTGLASYADLRSALAAPRTPVEVTSNHPSTTRAG